MKGTCPMCKEKGVDLTKHHVVEAPRDENGRIRSIGLCDNCHVSHNKYVMALRDNKIIIDRDNL